MIERVVFYHLITSMAPRTRGAYRPASEPALANRLGQRSPQVRARSGWRNTATGRRCSAFPGAGGPLPNPGRTRTHGQLYAAVRLCYGRVRWYVVERRCVRSRMSAMRSCGRRPSQSTNRHSNTLVLRRQSISVSTRLINTSAVSVDSEHGAKISCHKGTPPQE